MSKSKVLTLAFPTSEEYHKYFDQINNAIEKLENLDKKLSQPTTYDKGRKVDKKSYLKEIYREFTDIEDYIVEIQPAIVDYLGNPKFEMIVDDGNELRAWFSFGHYLRLLSDRKQLVDQYYYNVSYSLHRLEDNLEKHNSRLDSLQSINYGRNSIYLGIGGIVFGLISIIIGLVTIAM